MVNDAKRVDGGKKIRYMKFCLMMVMMIVTVAIMIMMMVYHRSTTEDRHRDRHRRDSHQVI